MSNLKNMVIKIKYNLQINCKDKIEYQNIPKMGLFVFHRDEGDTGDDTEVDPRSFHQPT